MSNVPAMTNAARAPGFLRAVTITEYGVPNQFPIALMPAGQAANPNVPDFGALGRMAGGNNATGTLTPAQQQGLSQETQTGLLTLAGTLLNTTGSALNTAITSGERVQIAQIQSATQQRLAELGQQISMTSNPTTLAQLQGQQAALQAVQDAIDAQQRAEYIKYGLIAVGGVVVVGGLIYFVRRSRSSGTRTNPVIGPRKHFVTAAKLRAQRARKGNRKGKRGRGRARK